MRNKVKHIINDYNSLLFCLLLIIGSIIFIPKFLSGNNIINILIEVSMLGFFTIGMSLLFIVGHFDMSMGMQITFGVMLVALTVNKIGIIAAMILCIVGCMVLGLINSVIVTQLKVSSWITTFAMQGTLKGVCLAVCDGNPIYIGNEKLIAVFNTNILGVPLSVLVVIILAVAAQMFLTFTKTGSDMYMLGGNAEAATYSGVSSTKVTIIAFVLSGFMVGVGAFLLAARVNSYNATMGIEYTIAAITAGVVGGVKFSGGYGTMLNAMLGVLAMKLVNNIMYMTNTYGFYITLVNGLILVLVLMIDSISARMSRNAKMHLKRG